MSQRSELDFRTALSASKCWTKTIVAAFSKVLSEEEILPALLDQSNEGKPSRIYISLYARLSRKGWSIFKIHEWLKEALPLKDRGVWGIVPEGIRKLTEVDGMRIVLNEPITIRPALGGEYIVSFDADEKGVIDFSGVPYKAGDISLDVNFPFAPVRFKAESQDYLTWVKWTDIEPVLDL